MKYWSVAKKLQLLETNQDPEKFNTMFLWIFWVGLGLNVMSGLLAIGVIFVRTLPWSSSYIWFLNLMQLCIFLSCAFLIDAFRLLSRQKPQNQAISKKQASLLSIAFGAFGTALLVADLAGLLGKITFEEVSRSLQSILFFMSCLILTFILSGLTEMQSAQYGRPDHSLELDASINSAESALTYNEFSTSRRDTSKSVVTIHLDRPKAQSPRGQLE